MFAVPRYAVTWSSTGHQQGSHCECPRRRVAIGRRRGSYPVRRHLLSQVLDIYSRQPLDSEDELER